MTISELTQQWINRDKKEHQRQLGRYWTSDLYSIIKGYLKPQDFFQKREVDQWGTALITTGIASEDILTKIFTDMKVKVECQAKKDFRISDDIILVAKPDYVFEKYIIETKCPLNPQNEIPEKWIYQLETYYRAFNLPVYLGVISHPFNVNLIKYCPSDAVWAKIQRSLLGFHKQLKELN